MHCLDLALPDPRHAELGWRVLVPQDVARQGGAGARRDARGRHAV